MPFGPLELILILVILLVLFGAKKLPEIGKNLGGGMREFKDSVTSKDDEQPRPAISERPADITPVKPNPPEPQPASERAPEPGAADQPPRQEG